jgi:hypothetical protein
MQNGELESLLHRNSSIGALFDSPLTSAAFAAIPGTYSGIVPDLEGPSVFFLV